MEVGAAAVSFADYELLCAVLKHMRQEWLQVAQDYADEQLEYHRKRLENLEDQIAAMEAGDLKRFKAAWDAAPELVDVDDEHQRWRDSKVALLRGAIEELIGAADPSAADPAAAGPSTAGPSTAGPAAAAGPAAGNEDPYADLRSAFVAFDTAGTFNEEVFDLGWEVDKAGRGLTLITHPLFLPPLSMAQRAHLLSMGSKWETSTDGKAKFLRLMRNHRAAVSNVVVDVEDDGTLVKCDLYGEVELTTAELAIDKLRKDLEAAAVKLSVGDEARDKLLAAAAAPTDEWDAEYRESAAEPLFKHDTYTGGRFLAKKKPKAASLTTSWHASSLLFLFLALFCLSLGPPPSFRQTNKYPPRCAVRERCAHHAAKATRVDFELLEVEGELKVS
jgi:hypothetical protein